LYETETERGPNQTDEGPPGSRDPPVLEGKTHAWISHHHQHPKKFRGLFRSQHNLPLAQHPRRKRLRQEFMGLEQRSTQKSLLPHIRRRQPTQRNRRIVKPHLPKTHEHRIKPTIHQRQQQLHTEKPPKTILNPAKHWRNHQHHHTLLHGPALFLPIVQSGLSALDQKKGSLGEPKEG
jgi:hypothetical protein